MVAFWAAPHPGHADQDVRRGLILWFDFTRQPQAGSVEDLSGNGFTAQLSGPVWAKGNGLYFDGEDDGIRVKNGEKIHSDTGLTVMGEIIPGSFNKKSWQNLVWKGDQPAYATKSDNREFSLWVNKRASLHATSTPSDWVGRGEIYINTRGGSITRKRMFAFVIDSAEATLKTYLDGNVAASGRYSTAGIRRTRGNLRIGGGTPDMVNAFFHGYIRWLRIYDRALSAGEIRQIEKFVNRDAPSAWRDPYRLSDVFVIGDGAAIIPIHDHSAFTLMDRDMFEPGVVIKHGWLARPNRGQPTELVFRHDGSPLFLSGMATVLDCLDFCGQKGLVEQMIYGDGKRLWASGPIRHNQPGKSFSVDLTGMKDIRLITTDGGDDVAEDWAAWLNLKLGYTGHEKNSAGPGRTVSPVISKPPVKTGKTVPSTQGKEQGIDRIYALAERPSGAEVTAVKNFSLLAEQIYIWFSFSNMAPGTIIKGVLQDEGRRKMMQEFPVVITRKNGHAGFFIRRPIEGWTPGRYRVDCKAGPVILATVNFQITR